MTSDGGLILVLELDERFGLSKLIGGHLVDSLTGRNRQFPLADLVRQRSATLGHTNIRRHRKAMSARPAPALQSPYDDPIPAPTHQGPEPRAY